MIKEKLKALRNVIREYETGKLVVAPRKDYFSDEFTLSDIEVSPFNRSRYCVTAVFDNDEQLLTREQISSLLSERPYHEVYLLFTGGRRVDTYGNTISQLINKVINRGEQEYMFHPYRIRRHSYGKLELELSKETKKEWHKYLRNENASLELDWKNKRMI